MSNLRYIINIIIVAILFGVVAISKDSQILGHSSSDLLKRGKLTPSVETQKTLFDGTIVINSTEIAKNVIGYAGQTPVELYVKGGIITKVEFLDNRETSAFFRKLLRNNLADEWVGMTLTEASKASIDAVTGATYSSEAIIANVQRAATYGADVKAENNGFLNKFDLKTILGILVIISGVVIAFAKPKRKAYRYIQLGLNVVILGFWCGSFLSLSQFTAWMSNGINLSSSILAVLLLLVVIITPFFGKKGIYCSTLCPMGSAQGLLYKIPCRKLKIGHKTSRILSKIRYFILLALLITMWAGVGFDIMNYEVFSAFIFNSASSVVLIMAVVFLILSLFFTRPYCRFICPTGATIHLMQNRKI